MMIHGFFGHPKEFEPLEIQCQQQGLASKAISLPGHGDFMDKSIAQIPISQMIDHCQQEFEAFSTTVDHMILVGHSLGGLCSLLLASKQPQQLKGVISLSAPINNANSFNNPLGIFKYKPSVLLNGLKYLPEQVTGYSRPTLKKRRFIQDALNLREEALYLLHQLPKPLEKINVPLLLAHSKYDMMVPFDQMSIISQQLSRHINVKTVELDQCGHQIFPQTRESRRMINEIMDFISTQQI